MNMTQFQAYLRIKKTCNQVRPDLSKPELRRFEDKFELAQEMYRSFGHYYSEQIRNFNTLIPYNTENIIIPLRAELYKFPSDHTSLMKFDSYLGWKERSKMVHWIDKIINKVQKYELMYPHEENFIDGDYDLDKRVESLKEREENLKDLMLREMGVDYDIFN